MADVKHADDDDVELNDIKADGKIGASDDSDADSVVDEDIEFPADAADNDIWLVKLPKSLMEKWSQVKQPGVPLCTMSVPTPAPGVDEHRITITLPEDAQYDTTGEGKSYRFNIPTKRVASQFVFGDQQQEDGPSAPKKARTTRFVGRVAHTGMFIPTRVDSTLTEKIRERNREAQKKDRTIVRIDGDGLGKLPTTTTSGITIPARTAVNYKQLQSGTAKAKAKLAFSQNRPAAKSKEHRAREARDVVLDKLFELFSRQDAWSFKDLQTATDQPADHLKDMLSMIAIYNQTGPLHGKYTLNATQKAILDSDRPPKEDMDSGEGPSGSQVTSEGGIKGEDGEDGMDDDGDDDEDDVEDFEEV